MNLADSIILITVILIVGLVIFGSVKKRLEARKNNENNHRCSGCAYKGFCGKLPKE